MEFRKRVVLALTLTAACGLVGCGEGKNNAGFQEFKPTDVTAVPEPEHSHSAPHGGRLVELGDHEYNAEVLFDEDEDKIVVYILDAHAENAHPIDSSEIVLNVVGGAQPAEYKLAAVKSDTDPAGQASQFEIVDEKLVDLFHEHEDLEALLSVVIDGKPYSGKVQHDEHSEHKMHEADEKPTDKPPAEQDASTEGAAEIDAPAKTGESKE